MKVQYKCGRCNTETMVEDVVDMQKLSCPCCGATKTDLKENDTKSKKIILKG